jgi:N-methylhydantoinase A
LYGHANPSRPAEIVSIRLTARGKTESPEFSLAEGESAITDAAVLETGPAVFEGKTLETPIYDRSSLRPGNRFDGPAIVVEASTTTVVPPDYQALVDPYGNLMLKSLAN